MQEHLHLARVPEGVEREYIRGALAFQAYEGKFFKAVANVFNLVIAFVILGASLYGLIGYIQGEEVSLVAVIIGFVMGILWIILFISIVSAGNIVKKTSGFQNLQVCDVMLTNIKGGLRTTSIYAKAVFRDGTQSKTNYEAVFYNIYHYQYGILVNVYDDMGQSVFYKILPRFEYESKPYQFSVKGIKKLK